MRIEIPALSAPGDLMADLREKLGLKHAAVVEAPASNLPGALAAPVGAMLQDIGLKPGAVLALGWGRAVRAVVEAGLPAIPGLQVVPATGGMQQHAPHFQVNEFVRLAAASLGGTPHFVHAPYLPSSAGGRDALLSDPAIASSVALWDRIDAAVVGVGLPHAANAPEAGTATPGERALADAAGDVIRHYFDAGGRSTDWDGESRMIAVSPEQLRRTPLVIGVAAGENKAGAILGAARAGFISAVVTDVRTAEAVLNRL